MSLLKRLSRSRPVQEALGRLFAAYLKLVQRTNRFIIEPADIHARLKPHKPVIVAMWHGQHFMVHFAHHSEDRAVALVSRSGDGELNASVLHALGIEAVRGSGARGRRGRERAGATALLGLRNALREGKMVVMTADVPKIARICGLGIVTLARLSGCPVVPVAVVTSRRLTFDSWDKACLGLPFGRGAIIIGDMIRVPHEATPEEQEAARRAIETGLDAVHARAFALVGRDDPGLALTHNRPPFQDQAA